MPNSNDKPQHQYNPLPSLAGTSQDTDMPAGTEPLASGSAEAGDFHRRTADVIFGEPSKVAPELRRAARTANFGILYGLDGKDWGQ